MLMLMLMLMLMPGCVRGGAWQALGRTFWWSAWCRTSRGTRPRWPRWRARGWMCLRTTWRPCAACSALCGTPGQGEGLRGCPKGVWCQAGWWPGTSGGCCHLCGLLALKNLTFQKLLLVLDRGMRLLEGLLRRSSFAEA